MPEIGRDQEVRQAVGAVLTEIDSDTGESGDIHLSNGIVLETVKVPPMLGLKVVKKFKYPPVPMFSVEDKAEQIPNPSDPDYIKRCAEIDEEQAHAVLDVLIAKGTRLKTLPAGLHDWKGEDWIEEVEFLIGEAVNKTVQLARYLDWVKFYACEEAGDLEKVALGVYRMFGITSDSVEAAFDSFRSEATRPAHTLVEAEQNGRDGD